MDNTPKEPVPIADTQVEPQSIAVCFIGLPAADQATFERVITFCAARGLVFNIASPAEADVFIVNDHPDSLQTAQQQQDRQLLLVVSNDQDCATGDMQVHRPLLVTRIMRNMETLAKQVGCTPRCKNTQAATDKSATPNAKPLADTQVHADQADALAPKQSYLALVIDDSAPIRKQLEIELRTTGIKCEFAESGEEALDKIAHHDYDLIFLDIMMPGIDGYETCGKIRKDPRYKRTPVIMLSGKDTPLDEVKGVIAGASTYLTKPIKHQQFKEVIQRIIRWLNDFR